MINYTLDFTTTVQVGTYLPYSTIISLIHEGYHP